MVDAPLVPLSVLLFSPACRLVSRGFLFSEGVADAEVEHLTVELVGNEELVAGAELYGYGPGKGEACKADGGLPGDAGSDAVYEWRAGKGLGVFPDGGAVAGDEDGGGKDDVDGWTVTELYAG